MKKTVQTKLVEKIAEDTGLFEHQVARVLQSLTQNVIDDLCSGKNVYIKSFGRFYLRKSDPRVSWDPYRNTPKPMDVRWIPKFRFGRRALEAIRQQVKLSAKRPQD